MIRFLLISILSTLLLSNSDCHSKKNEENLYRGRLEIRGLCLNYTIAVIDGNMDESLIESEWTDEITGKHYENVFALGSPCNFPSTIKAGDEFNFVIDSTTPQHCEVCLAYYPVPPKKLSIKVVER